MADDETLTKREPSRRGQSTHCSALLRPSRSAAAIGANGVRQLQSSGSIERKTALARKTRYVLREASGADFSFAVDFMFL